MPFLRETIPASDSEVIHSPCLCRFLGFPYCLARAPKLLSLRENPSVLFSGEVLEQDARIRQKQSHTRTRRLL